MGHMMINENKIKLVTGVKGVAFSPRYTNLKIWTVNHVMILIRMTSLVGSTNGEHKI